MRSTWRLTLVLESELSVLLRTSCLSVPCRLPTLLSREVSLAVPVLFVRRYRTLTLTPVTWLVVPTWGVSAKLRLWIETRETLCPPRPVSAQSVASFVSFSLSWRCPSFRVIRTWPPWLSGIMLVMALSVMRLRSPESPGRRLVVKVLWVWSLVWSVTRMQKTILILVRPFGVLVLLGLPGPMT